MNSKPKHICCNIDDGYAQHCGVMLTSLFAHSNEKFEVHILISSLNEKNRKHLKEIVSKNNSICHFHEVKAEELVDFKYSNGRRKLSEATYYRLFISSVLDESISKVLYLDSDIIVQRDLSPLFNIDLNGYALAATKDLYTMTDEYRFELSLQFGASYFNAGMMLINLDYWRKTDAEQELVAFAMRERSINNQDQDALNAVFRDRWFMLSPKWSRFFPYNYEKSFFENHLDKEEFIKSPSIIHFYDLFKPWNKITWYGRRWKKFKKQYYTYLEQTPWRGFKPKKMDIEKYQKYGLYKYLVTYETISVFFGFRYRIKSIIMAADKLFFLPFLLAFKIYHLFLGLKSHRHTRDDSRDSVYISSS